MTSTDNAHATTTAQLLDPCNKVAIRLHIIAFRFHYHHEISAAFHVEQYLGIAFALREKEMQIIDDRGRGIFGLQADAQRARQ